MKCLGRLSWLVLALVAAGCSKQRETTRLRRFDVHVHAPPEAVPRLVEVMGAHGIDVAVNLSGGWPGSGLEASLTAARATSGRVMVFATPPLERLAQGIEVETLVNELERAHQLGARGVKFYKALGLSYRDAQGALFAVDDMRLDALFEKAGALGMPVAIHTGDPVAFWQPADAQNERIDELKAHPRWSYAGRPVPSWEALYDAFERRVARHPRTTFIGVHFGNAPESPSRVAAMLDRYPNVYVDTAARVPELGRRASEVRALVLKHSTRVLFGTDLGVGSVREELMLGSTGLTPPSDADVERFFSATWRFFETSDVGFEHPTPIQGRWLISGLGLPSEVLERVYWKNAAELLGVPQGR